MEKKQQDNLKDNREMVTCIIPTYRQMDYLLDSIKSVLLQDYPCIELIITDDASDNFNEALIKKYINANNSGNIINYEIIINQENVGTVKNMNGALKQAQGEIIIPLAADDIFYNDHVITDIVKRFAETKCEIMSCSRLMFSNDMTQEIRLMPHIGYRGYIERHMNTAQKQYKQMSLGRSYEFASGAALYYRTSLMKRLGWYDERYVLWEDGPLLARCAREGIKICTAYDIVSIKYRAGGISTKKKSNIPTKIQTDYCNLIKYEYIDYPNNFTKSELKTIQGRWILQKNFGNISKEIILKYPGTIFNLVYLKISKLVLRLMRKNKEH